MNERLTIKPHQRQIAAFGLSTIAEAFTFGDESGNRFVWKIQEGLRNLNEFLFDIYPAPDLTEKEALLSSRLHTYMRKYMDSMFSCMLYRLIAENRGKGVWYSFIKSLIKNNYNISKALNDARDNKNETDTTDDLLMFACLDTWNESYDLKDAIEEVKGWD